MSPMEGGTAIEGTVPVLAPEALRCKGGDSECNDVALVLDVGGAAAAVADGVNGGGRDTANGESERIGTLGVLIVVPAVMAPTTLPSTAVAVVVVLCVATTLTLAGPVRAKNGTLVDNRLACRIAGTGASKSSPTLISSKGFSSLGDRSAATV